MKRSVRSEKAIRQRSLALLEINRRPGCVNRRKLAELTGLTVAEAGRAGDWLASHWLVTREIIVTSAGRLVHYKRVL